MSIYANAANKLRPKEVDLQPVLDAVSENSTKLTALLDALSEAPSVDLEPVLTAIQGINIPELDLDGLTVDLEPVLTALAGIRGDQLTIENIQSALETATGQLVSADDLAALEQMIASVSQKVDEVKTTTTNTDAVVTEHHEGWREFIEVLGNG